LLDPLELIEKLAVLVAAPRFHLLHYHGAAWRSDVIPRRIAAVDHVAMTGSPPPCRSAGLSWAALLKRVFALDVLECPRCGGRRRIVGVHTGGERLRALLERRGLGAPSAASRPSRSPPGVAEFT
jgi:hypothetical protein